eukprot:1218990-Rhodomonas_salina.2
MLLAGGARESARAIRACRVSCAICLRTCYAMPGTGMAYRAICLRACYAMPGTDLAYQVLHQHDLHDRWVRRCG